MALPIAKIATPEKLLTYEDYAALPDDGCRYELLEGRLSVVPAPFTKHQRGSLNLVYVLKTHVDRRKLGELFEAPFDVILGPHDTVQPDVLFVSREHAGRISERGVEGAPDLVIEIVSTGSASRDWIEKLRIYQRAGVPEYWVVEPEARCITVLVLQGDSYSVFSKACDAELVKSTTFPELELAPAKLFDPPRFDE